MNNNLNQQHPDSIIIKMKAEAGYPPTELQDKYVRLVGFLKQEIKMRDYVCVTNHAVLLDNAKELLKEIGELE